MTKPGFTWDKDNPLARVYPDRAAGNPGEIKRAHRGLIHYYRMGSGGSYAKLNAAYNLAPDANPTTIAIWQSDGHEPPAKRLGTVEAWGRDYDWQARVTARWALDEAHRVEGLRAEQAEVNRRATAAMWDVVQSLEQMYTTAHEVALEAARDIETNVTRGQDGIEIKVALGHLIAGEIKEFVDAYSKVMDELRRAQAMPHRYTATDVTTLGEALPPAGGAIDITHMLTAAQIQELMEELDDGDA